MEWLTDTWALGPAIAGFAVATAVVGATGVRLARVVDHLADRTGLGEALAGALLLGAATSLSGLIVSVVGAAEGNASLAVSNSLGGIAAQTAFLAVADLAYRRGNLEHAAASMSNVFNSLLMIILLGIVLIGVSGPEATVLGVHPVTPLLVAAYVYGVRISREAGEAQMWQPVRTEETVVDEPRPEAHGESTGRMWVSFFVLGAVLSAAGWAVGRSGLSIIAATGLSATLVGTFFTAVSTSLPELVTSVAAVRAGAPTLAIGGIVGGNTFDVLFIAVSDGVYREGSIYSAVAETDVFVIGWTLVLVSIAGAGLVRRERERGIGFEGVAILVVYLAGLLTLSLLL